MSVPANVYFNMPDPTGDAVIPVVKAQSSMRIVKAEVWLLNPMLDHDKGSALVRLGTTRSAPARRWPEDYEPFSENYCAPHIWSQGERHEVIGGTIIRGDWLVLEWEEWGLADPGFIHLAVTFEPFIDYLERILAA